MARGTVAVLLFSVVLFFPCNEAKNTVVQETDSSEQFAKVFESKNVPRGVKGESRSLKARRNLEDSCDRVFSLECLPSRECKECFSSLTEADVDWANIGHEQLCYDVVDRLIDGGDGLCLGLRRNPESYDAFCNTYVACSVKHRPYDYNDSNKKKKKMKNKKKKKNGHKQKNGQHYQDRLVNQTEVMHANFDCKTLTTCEWDGIQPNLIGDGVCHSDLEGCYNSPACRFDGGDCCVDTCTTTNSLKPCGSMGYSCIDPFSSNCDSSRTKQCGIKEQAEQRPARPCPSHEVPFDLIMHDSFGNGWQDIQMTIRKQNSYSAPTFRGALQDGRQGEESLCLSMGCYTVNITGGVWGEHISWEIRSRQKGGRFLARGGGPMNCTFPHLAMCENTCLGDISGQEPWRDPNYRTLEKMSGCLDKRCQIQIGACMAKESCRPCMNESVPAFCYADHDFNALLSCGLCQCRDDTTSVPKFCEESTSYTTVAIEPSTAKEAETFSARECNAIEMAEGAATMTNLSAHTGYLQYTPLVYNDDDDDDMGERLQVFDVFQGCVDSYKSDPYHHGGYTALQCMKILRDQIVKEPHDDYGRQRRILLVELYKRPQVFCSSAVAAFMSIPSCVSFNAVSAFLHNILDTCEALNNIRCDAFQEFALSCRNNMLSSFGNTQFNSRAHCFFVDQNCGEESLPRFQRSDCGTPSRYDSTWAFYESYVASCSFYFDDDDYEPSFEEYGLYDNEGLEEIPDDDDAAELAPEEEIDGGDYGDYSDDGNEGEAETDYDGFGDDGNEEYPYVYGSGEDEENDNADAEFNDNYLDKEDYDGDYEFPSLDKDDDWEKFGRVDYDDDGSSNVLSFNRTLTLFSLLAALGGVGYYVYIRNRRRRDDDAFTYSSYRRAPPGGGDGLYSQVSSTEASRFEPPTISVTPIAPIESPQQA